MPDMDLSTLAESPDTLADPIAVCPGCYYANIYERDIKRPAYRCSECGEEFAEPVYREAAYRHPENRA